MTMTHFFIGISLQEAAAKSIYDQTSLLREEKLFKSWVHPLDYHLTLAFLGHPSSENQLNQVKQVLEKNLASYQSFDLQITEFQTFGRPQSPRIFWLGIEESEKLAELRSEVYQICQDAGFKLDERPFAPHITVARKWISEKDFLEQLIPSPEKLSFKVTAVDLFKTKLDEVPKYHSIHNVMLR
ncbi:RNA 2',3'-cyclic phosphodiesterase [Metabacillus idriensis]|uniref:RNA 2',3'-cyclic phosphodiesterase n=1 Tax=Metabacillus idriensis TaxID=324768 RepID=UPI002812CFB3|nr:RNA 2',3'-cyclic phosphodiesterase [Metabacillus idriensis]MDR0137973.1 RNA 2',3'-cyclic phosphodiesterase [Metabacillus idriensis]